MTDKDVRAWHIAVRAISCVTLFLLLWSLVADKYYPAWSHSFANSSVGVVAVLWVTLSSLLLPLFVAFEVWREKGVKSNGRALLIDGMFAAACLTLFVVTILLSFKRYAMF
jgi:hypothetical protein